MPLFEEMPWLLIPIIIASVEIWSALKRAASQAIKAFEKSRHLAYPH